MGASLDSAIAECREVVELRRSKLGEENPETLKAMNRLAALLVRSGNLAEGRRLQEHVVRVTSRHLPDSHPVLLMLTDQLASILEHEGDYAGARTLRSQILERRRATLGNDHPDTLEAMVELAGDQRALGDLDHAQELLREATQTLTRQLGEEQPATIAAALTLAEVLRDMGRLDEVREMQEHLLEVVERALPEDDQTALTVRNNLASTLHAQGELGRARGLRERVLEGRRRTLRDDHPETLTALNNLAEVLRSQGELERARSVGIQAAEGRRRVLGPDHPATLNATNNLALTLLELEDLVGARQLQEQVLEARRRQMGDEHPLTLGSLHNVAFTTALEGDCHTARGMLETVVAGRRRLLGGAHPDTVGTALVLASVLVKLGDLPRAQAVLEETKDDSACTLGEEHPQTRDVAAKLANVLWARGDRGRALELQVGSGPAARGLSPREKEVLSAGLRAFADARTEDKRRAVLERHPELLDPAVELGPVAMDLVGADLEYSFVLVAALRLLERCRSIGLQALAEPHPDMTMEMAQLTSSQPTGDGLAGAASVIEESDADALADAASVIEEPDADDPAALLAAAEAHRQRFRAYRDPADLDASIELAARAGEVDTAGLLHGDALEMLANALVFRFSGTGERANLDRGIDSAARAAEASREPGDRARRLIQLASGLRLRFKVAGDATDLDRAIEAGQAALDLTSPEDPELFKRINDLGSDLRRRFEARGKQGDLSHAIGLLSGALEQVGEGPGRALVLMNLGAALVMSYELTGERSNLDAGLDAAREAVAETPEDDPDGAPRRGNLASALTLRYERDGSGDDLDEAVDQLREATRITASDAPQTAANAAALGSVLLRRHWHTGALNDLDEAVGALRHAVELESPGSPQLPGRYASLGAALLARYRTTADRADLDDAVKLFTRGLETAPSARERPPLLSQLGEALLARYDATGDPGDLDAALTSHEQAVALTPPGAPDLARCEEKLAATRMLRFTDRSEADELDAALSAYRRALELTDETSPQKITLLYSLGIALSIRHQHSQLPEDEAEATAALRAGARRGASEAPRAGLTAAQAWGHLAAERGDWTEAAEAYVTALEASERLITGEPGRPGKETWLRVAADLHAPAAYALARSGDAAAGVLALERGRALLLTDTLRGGEDPRGLLTPMSVGDVAAVGPVAYIAATGRGGCALVVTADSAVEVVWLDGLTTAELAKRIWAFLGARGGPGWEAAIDDITGWLWPTVMAPLFASMVGQEPLTLVPMGILGLLPLHAAWRNENGAPSGRWYALDERRLTYATNARVLARCRDRASTTPAESLLVIADGATLRHASREAEHARRHFPRATVLGDDPVAVDDVLAGLAQSDVLHFACHGASHPTDPAASCLRLPGGESLTAGEIVARRLTHARLAVLSACESAVPGADLPDETVGLPAAFIEAGAAGVVGSLWEVPDLSTMVLMGRLYELWRSDEVEPAEALRQAQQWLRDAPNREKRERLEDLTELAGPELPTLARADWEAGSDQASPLHWAAFTFLGA